MTRTLDIKFKIGSWDEVAYRELPDGTKFARADIVLEASSAEGDRLGDSTSEALLFYRADGTSSFVMLFHVTATLEGRTGSFVLQGDGTFDGSTAREELVIVAGSGTDGLAGIAGTASSASTHDDYPFMPLVLNYDLG